MSTVASREADVREFPKLVETSESPLIKGSLYLNRELSLLEFHARVLEEAADSTNPLLERLKFISIFASNLDEFFMIRVSGLKEGIESDVVSLSPDGLTPREQLERSRKRILELLRLQTTYLNHEILPAMRNAGLELANYRSLSPAERKELDHYFEKKIYPVLTPLAVDPSHPFPYISPLSVNIGLMVEAPEVDIQFGSSKQVEPRFVRIKVPSALPRLVPVGTKFVLLEEIIEANLQTLFPGAVPGQPHRFRVTRDADIEIREQEASDLLSLIEEGLRKRRFGAPVRLEVSPDMPDEMIDYLRESLNLDQDDIYFVETPLHVQDLMNFCDADRPELKDAPFAPVMPEWVAEYENIFDAIRERDRLVHHPYDSYTCVTDFINQAADDDDVVAIKICLYRTGPDSPIPPALIRASERGKQVTALIELKARFDEVHNIEWARKLDEAGVHVVYGILGLKTHGKLTLVVRREADELRRYVHIASGNYNPTTSCTYTDLGLFTVDETVGRDATELFNYLTGFSRQTDYRKLSVAPINLRERLTELLDREMAHKLAGRPAQVIAKFNRLADQQIIQKLYEVSQAGVQVDLIVRGICMLKPGVPGLSDNIRVRSVVGRFLEHSRIFYFANGGDAEVYLGSADWMARNLKHRIEVVAPVQDEEMKRYLIDVLLDAYLKDNTKARELQSDGSYAKVSSQTPHGFNSQLFFMESRVGQEY